jgi:asparagine synthase (glutamine-hydrolysing)
MCGICGVFNYRSGKPVDEPLLRYMANQIIHRGPDDDGFYINGSVGLGMRRLSIIDLEGGHQPMSNEDGTVWIVLNGEIYNFPDLRRDLESKGHIFRTRSDTETVIHAYEEWGVNAFSKLNGMYGFALWDGKKQEILLARDPYGIKPLYYGDINGSLLFGSEIKAILASDPPIRREVNLSALDQYFTFMFVPSPNTMFMGINKLPPGYILRVNSENGVSLERFYRLIPSDHQYKSKAEWLEALRFEIEAAVRRQMVADVPVGVLLSGGVDSATVATLMSSFAGTPIHSFTVGFGEDFSLDELKAARRSSELIGTEHHEAIITADQYAEFLPRSLWHLEEPMANISALAFYWICRLARETVKVVLTGQGADEPFAGYPRHFGEYYGDVYRCIPSPFRKHVFTPLADYLPRNEQLKRAVHALDLSNPLLRLTQVYSVFDEKLKQQLYRSGLMNCQDYSLSGCVAFWQKDVQHLDGLSQMLYVDSRFSLPDNLLICADKMSMSVSLEARVPFLDLELMSFVENLPSSLKIHRFTQKYLLKKAVSAWVAPEVIKRKKIGFAVPMDGWFGRELRTFVGEQLLASNSACMRYFEPATIKQMITDHETGRHDYKRHLFSLLTFELWHQQFTVG